MRIDLKFIIMAVFLPYFLLASPEPELGDKLSGLVHDFRGEVGIYVRQLVSGETVEIQADSLFPTASMIKVPILLKIFDKIETGELNYKTPLAWHADTVNYPYDGSILWSYEEGKTIPLDQLITLMITYSDNHASLWLQKLAGGGGAINRWLAEHGFSATRVNSRTERRKSAYEKYGWGQTSPREMAELLVMIRQGRAVSPAASEEMYRILTRPYWDDTALSRVPPDIQVAAKNGAVDRSRSEVVLVNAPSGDYVFCVITKNQQDESWTPENEGFELLRKVSRILWEHFEPDHPWSPAEGMEKYY